MSTEPKPHLRTSISWIRATCRSCGGEMIDVWELGAQRINTFPLSQVEADRVPKVPLTLARCHPCGLLQLRHTTNPDLLFGVKEERPYWYKCIGASEKLFARVNNWGRCTGRDYLVHETADAILSKPYDVELPCVGTDGSIEWRKVINREESVQDVYVIEFYTGARVVASANHKWPLVNKRLRWDKEVTTEQLKHGDRVALIHEMTRPSGVVDYGSVYDYEAGYFLGVYLAEGCLSGPTIRLTVHESNDAPMVDKVKEFVTGRLYEGFSSFREKKKHTLEISVTGKVVNGLVSKFVRGHTAWKKHLTNDVWAQPLVFIKGLVDGWLDGDGHYEPDQERWRFNVCRNADLVEDMALACRLIDYRMRYCLRVGGHHPPAHSQPNQYCGWVRKSAARSRQHLRLGRLGLTSVRRIWKQGVEKRTWDVSIGGEELYSLGCGIVTHNSGIQPAMVAILKEVVEEAKALVPLKYGDTVIDIGANDGTLLSFYPNGIRRVGFEPARNLHEKLQEHSEVMVSTYFPAPQEVTQTYLKPGSAKVISSCAMFYDLEDPLAFCEEVKRLLHPNGIWVNQLAYLPSMLDRSAFDSICHEHLTYWSFRALAPLLERAGLQVIKAQLLPEVNEGSIRFFITHRESKVAVQFADLKMLHELGVREADEGYADQNEPYLKLKRAAEEIARQLRLTTFGAFVKGEPVDLLGASTKGNSLLQYVRLDTQTIRRAIERSPEKVGRCTVTGIPIVSEEEGRRDPAKWLLVLPWAFREALIERERGRWPAGTRLVFPLPKLELIEL